MFLINQKVSEDRKTLGYSSMNISNGHHKSRMRSIEVMYWVVGSRVYLLRVRELNCLLRIHKNIGEIDSEGAAYSVSPNFSI